MGKRDSQVNLLEHSKAKVTLLGKYLQRYLNIIANDGYTQRIKIYDLYCGDGIYDNKEEGSPLVILRAIKELHSENVSRLKQIIPIDCQFNDIENEKVLKVKEAVEKELLHSPEFGEIIFTVEDYQVEVKRLLAELPKLKKQKKFIFIDPYGYKNIKPSDIKAILECGDTEVLLFLPTQFMYRFDRKGTPPALKEFNDELNIIQDERNTISDWQYIEQLKVRFRELVSERYFVDTFTIEKDPNTIFCLFFFCNHIRGFEKMIDAKWEIDTERGKGYSYKGGNLELFSPTYELESKLKKYLEDGQRSNGDIYEFTLRLGFRPKHAKHIFESWQKIPNNFVVVDSKGKVARKGSFYINYDDYKNHHNKVNFKLI